jgi:hypothetical protein
MSMWPVGQNFFGAENHMVVFTLKKGEKPSILLLDMSSFPAKKARDFFFGQVFNRKDFQQG